MYRNEMKEYELTKRGVKKKKQKLLWTKNKLNKKKEKF